MCYLLRTLFYQERRYLTCSVCYERSKNSTRPVKCQLYFACNFIIYADEKSVQELGLQR